MSDWRCCITLVFLNQGFLIQPETINALRRIPNLRVVCIDITSHPDDVQIECLCKLLLEHQCRILFSVNEWGIDTRGILKVFLEKHAIIHINWYVDDPFYEELILTKKFIASELRIDFVSDKDYLPRMIASGYHAYFLPLGTDLSVFFPCESTIEHECVFVGNSYVQQMDELLIGADDLIIPMTDFLASLIQKFNKNNKIDIEREIAVYLQKVTLPSEMSLSKAIFLAKHFVGYLYRKKVVTGLVNTFTGFTVVGDVGWTLAVDPKRVIKVGYYSGLRQLYNTSVINVDVNRLVIRNGFTQRTFDTLASKCFCITSAKDIVSEYFVTTGDKKEIVMFHNSNELYELIRYYLKHDKERKAIVERGYQKVVSMHTYDHRVAEIFSKVSEFIGK
jgi:spore maturation protein CgeB